MKQAEGTKWVYLFGQGSKDWKDMLGGKGANLAEMTNLGLPVPPGFTITTLACREYLKSGDYPDGMMDEVREGVRALEEAIGKGWGDPKNPLLVSVRSGARDSMPGMMDTILNLGLNDQTVAGLIELTKDERFVYDAYRRFIMMFGNVTLDLGREPFERMLQALKDRLGVKSDTDVPAAELRTLCDRYKEYVKQQTGKDFPEDPWQQLELSILAVFGSWNNKRAHDYREHEGIPHDLGTAANIQTMVFGNMGEDCGTGVAFTRDVATGEKRLYAEYLFNAQGEDVVAGVRTPMPIEELAKRHAEIYKEFVGYADMLEKHYRDVMDIEFTIERGRLYVLQCRVGKRTPKAAVKIAVDMANEGLIDRAIAINRVQPDQINHLLLPRFDPAEQDKAIKEGRLLAKGLNASPGQASGIAVFDADTAEQMGKQRPVILVRPETNPDDVHGMLVSKGILTARGGATSHAAVVARGLGLPCVAGCESLHISEEKKALSVNGMTVREGDEVSIDGTSGEVFKGAIKTIDPEFEKEVELQELLEWADEASRLQVWANADYPRDAARARLYGAVGIGLCRTEHMFMEEERLPIVRAMILADSVEERKRQLDRLLPLQREDFRGIFHAMNGYPVVIRLIDPPLHEFLPNYADLRAEVAELRLSKAGSTELKEAEEMLRRVDMMREANPMLGLRGVRLSLVMPEIVEMQTRAIIEAACEAKDEGVVVKPKIMVPLVGHVNELKRIREQLEKVAQQVLAERKKKIKYQFGTMIEVPRGALTAGEIARVADFFSFGTNDLTQMAFGFSRDDAEGKFLLRYLQDGILPDNPFQTLDVTGVGRLMEIAAREGKKANRKLELGICGEHGGDPRSVEFCHKIKLNYVSCSPFRVPIARLAAAQAALGGLAESASK
jgi:pyruvate,orthophosphate dikinase